MKAIIEAGGSEVGKVVKTTVRACATIALPNTMCAEWARTRNAGVLEEHG